MGRQIHWLPLPGKHEILLLLQIHIRILKEVLEVLVHALMGLGPVDKEAHVYGAMFHIAVLD